MTQYNMLNVKMSNTKFNRLKSEIKNGTEVTLSLSSNLIRNSNDEINLPHKLLLTQTQVSKIRKAFANGLSPNDKLAKKKSYKVIHKGDLNYQLVCLLIDLCCQLKIFHINEFNSERIKEHVC